MENLSSLLDDIKAEDHKKIRLYLIIRELRGDVPKYKKMLNKFKFKSMSIDIDEELQKHLHKTIVDQINFKCNSKKYEFVEYDLIDDDTHKVYTYTLNDNKVLPFADMIKEQLAQGVDIKPIMKLNEVREHIWAYCIGILHDDKKPTYTLRKFYPSKIGVDEPADAISKGVHTIRTWFNTSNSKLQLLQGETISFDKNIDTIYIDDKFYIFSKNNFERIVGLEEELRANALNMVKEISELNLIDGMDTMLSEIDQNPTLLKRLAKLAQHGDYKNITSDRIMKMQEIATQHGFILKVENGKIKIENNKDIDIVIKMLDDYFLESQQTGFKYGSHAKKQLKVVTAQ